MDGWSDKETRSSQPLNIPILHYAAYSQPFPPGVTGVQLMPELDVFLILLPTQENLFPTDNGRKIHQPAVQVLELDFTPVEFQQHLFDFRQGSHPIVDYWPAQFTARRHHFTQTLILPFQFAAKLTKPGQPMPDLRQQCPRFLARVVFLELVRHDSGTLVNSSKSN